MSDRLDELGDTTDVALVTFTDPENLPPYQRSNKVAVPILIDPDRSAYRAYGLGRGSFARIYGWKAALRYLQIFKANGIRDLRRPTEDTLQLGGDFIIGADGTLIYGYWGAGPDDRPSVKDLINAIPSPRS